MAKRPGLETQLEKMRDTAAAVEATAAGVTAPAEARAARRLNTGVTLQQDTLQLLKLWGIAQAAKHGGRGSVSSAIERLVRKHKSAIERDIKTAGILPE